MEAVAVQNVPKDVGAKPSGPPKGPKGTSEETFGDLMHKLRSEDEGRPKAAEEKSKAKTADETTSVDAGSRAPGAQADEAPKAADEKFAEGLSAVAARESKGAGADEAAVPFTTPRPAADGFAEALAELVADGPPGGEPAQVSAKDIAAQAAGEQAEGGAEEASETAANSARQGLSAGLQKDSSELEAELVAAAQKKLDQAAKSGLHLSGQKKAEESSQAGQGKASEAQQKEARVLLSSNLMQSKGFEAKQDDAAAFSSDVSSSQEAPKVAPTPTMPKEAVEVEAAQLAKPDESNEPEVAPIKPASGGHALHSGERSVEGMAQQPSSAPSADVSSANRPSAPPVVGRIVEKVVEVVQAGGPQGKHEVTIQLDPPSLGRVHLHMVVEDAKLHVALFTTTQEARDLVQSNVNQLKAALDQQGLGLEQFSVDVRSGLAQNTSQQDWAAWQDRGPTHSLFGPQAAGPAGQALESMSYLGRRDALAQIDLFI